MGVKLSKRILQRKRNAKIAKMAIEELYTYSELSKIFKLSRGRIGQIVLDYKIEQAHLVPKT